MTREENKQGTSLEVLAPYLPYGIEIEIMPPNGFRAKLTGLVDAEAVSPDSIVKKRNCYWSLRAVLPILRPFSQLVEPLSDGTIPAVEVAKLLLAHQYDVQHHRYEAAHIRKVHCKQPGLECFEITVAGLNDNLVVAIYNNLDLESEDRGIDSADVLAVADYLRSQHFAVGLEPHQYIPTPPASLQ